MLVRFLVLELLFQALSRYSKILVYTCISTIFCSRTVILQLLVVQVVWFLLQFLCLRCIARSAYVFEIAKESKKFSTRSSKSICETDDDRRPGSILTFANRQDVKTWITNRVRDF